MSQTCLNVTATNGWVSSSLARRGPLPVLTVTRTAVGRVGGSLVTRPPPVLTGTSPNLSSLLTTTVNAIARRRGWTLPTIQFEIQLPTHRSLPHRRHVTRHTAA